jgi:hypothetical protein
MNDITTTDHPPRRVSANFRGIRERALFEITEGPHQGEVVFVRVGDANNDDDFTDLTRDLIARGDVIAKARELAAALSAYVFAMDTDASDRAVIEAAAEVARAWSEAIALTS